LRKGRYRIIWIIAHPAMEYRKKSDSINALLADNPCRARSADVLYFIRMTGGIYEDYGIEISRDTAEE
jgi:hypothetical protein